MSFEEKMVLMVAAVMVFFLATFAALQYWDRTRMGSESRKLANGNYIAQDALDMYADCLGRSGSRDKLQCKAATINVTTARNKVDPHQVDAWMTAFDKEDAGRVNTWLQAFLHS